MGFPMPELHGEALELYRQAHPERLYKYRDHENTSHGGRSPSARGIALDEIDEGSVPTPHYFHRAEYDVESVYWSMVCTLLRAHPRDAPKEKYACDDVEKVWAKLLSHQIPMLPAGEDERTAILTKRNIAWRALFFQEMHDVARLLHQISRHIASEYALFDWDEGKYHEDHLHEAVQRLILDYLVSHRNNPIPLDPDHLRPTDGPSMERKNAHVANSHASGTQLVGTGPGMWREGRKGPLYLNDADITPAPAGVAKVSPIERAVAPRKKAGRPPARALSRHATADSEVSIQGLRRSGRRRAATSQPS